LHEREKLETEIQQLRFELEKIKQIKEGEIELLSKEKEKLMEELNNNKIILEKDRNRITSFEQEIVEKDKLLDSANSEVEKLKQEIQKKENSL